MNLKRRARERPNYYPAENPTYTPKCSSKTATARPALTRDGIRHGTFKRHSSVTQNWLLPPRNTVRHHSSGSRNRQMWTYIDHRILEFDMKPVVGDGDHSIIRMAEILHTLTLQHRERDLQGRHRQFKTCGELWVPSVLRAARPTASRCSSCGNHSRQRAHCVLRADNNTNSAGMGCRPHTRDLLPKIHQEPLSSS